MGTNTAPDGSRGGPDGSLSDPGRRLALAELGLGSEADPAMEAIVGRVRRRLGVPVALVSLVSPDEQVFPGMAGLPEPWAGRRSTPLTHSFCRHVVLTAQPLVITDAREHPELADNLAIPDLGVVGYAGMPLTDDAGHVLGSLCAIDTRPHAWTDTELEDLREIAEACANQLRLRLARFAAAVERGRRDALERRLRQSFAHSQALLVVAQDFNDTVSVEDVRRRVEALVESELCPSMVGLVLVEDDGRLRRLTALPGGTGVHSQWLGHYRTAQFPSAVAVREGRLVVHEDRASLDAAHDEATSHAVFRDTGAEALIAAPLLGVQDTLGALVLGWEAPRRFDQTDLLTFTTIAGYAARALERAQRLQHRTDVAAQMQQALLTTLPAIDGLDVAACYQPADAREQVGGDWYDLTPLPDGPAGGSDVPVSSCGRGFVLSVGDIMGHDVAAATVMGQTRSMLRQAGWGLPKHPPSAVLSAFEEASAGLGMDAAGTAVLAHLRPGPAGSWSMDWTNAGHPPPILLPPGRPPVVLDDHDQLFGFSRLLSTPRRDQHRELTSGTAVVFYTDGLVERRGDDIDAGIARLVDLLDRRRDATAQGLVEAVLAEMAVDALDDIVVLAVQVPALDSPTV